MQTFRRKGFGFNHAGVEIVNHLLELSKVQQLNRADLSRVNVAEIIRNVLQENMELIGDRVQVHTNLENAYILADGLLIRQMIANLITNAIQHNRAAQPHVWINLANDRQYEGESCIAIDISNTGMDLSDTRIDDFLSPFNRGEDNRINTHVGSASPHHGLGLSIVQEIVAMHHGHLSLQARPEGGLRILILLPDTL